VNERVKKDLAMGKKRGENVTPLLSAMAPIHNSYIVPFDPFGAPGPTVLTTTQGFNRMFKRLRQGSAETPYPDVASIYCQSAISDPGDDMFEDLYLGDMWVCHLLALDAMLTIYGRVQANKRISHHQLLGDPDILGNLRGILEHGVQVKMDAEEVMDDSVKVTISYTGSIRTSLWSKIKQDRTQVGLGYDKSLLTWLTWS
jgi:hypothetical protein